MSLLLCNHERTNLIVIIATMAIFTAITPSAYSINIEYQLDPEGDEMMMDEENFAAISVIQGIRNSFNKKSEFLAHNLKSFDNLPFKQYKNIPQEPEKGVPVSSIGNKITISESDVQSKNTTQDLKEKHGLEEAEENSSSKKKTDRNLQDNKPVAKTLKYSIQVNSYSQKTNADNLVRQLKKENYECFSSEIYDPVTKETHYRVFVGKYNDLQSAKKACGLLKKKKKFTDNIFVVNQSWVTGE